jgi:hypothetical protein
VGELDPAFKADLACGCITGSGPTCSCKEPLSLWPPLNQRSGERTQV